MTFDLSTLYEDLLAHPRARMRFLGLDGKLMTRSFAAIHCDVLAVMAELRDCGVEPGDLVGIVGPNSYDWLVADLALLALDCVSVPLPHESRAERLDDAATIERYELAALLVGPTVRLAGEPSPSTATLGARPYLLTRRDADHGERKIDPDVFTIAFSSGTAGTKKGLLLTRSGVVNTIETSARAWGVRPDDDILVVLPFSSFQQRYLCYTAIRYGCTATVVAPERMFQKMRDLEPTIVLGPPSFFEILETRIRAAGRRDRLAFRGAAVLHRLAPRLTRPLRAALGRRFTDMYGTRVRLMLTGSAPVPPRLVTLFQRVGAPLHEVYGSTEVGWIAFNLPGRSRTGSAGIPVPGVRVTLAEDGEILVRAAHPQALGYVFDGEETQDSVFLEDGTIATGDVGRWNGRFLTLTGRKKNVIITRSGVKINPESLEREVEAECPGAKVVVVTEADAATLACVVFADDWRDPARVAAVEGAVAVVNGRHPSTHRLSRVVMRPTGELSAATGLLTRNLKVDRDAVVRAVFAETAR